MNNSLPTPPAQGNVSFVLRRVDDTVLEDRPVRPLRAGEVRVNVRQTGLCGSDCHYRSHGRIGEFVLEAPMVLGHESSGIVSEVGPGVTTHAVGDRVALEPGVPCLSCSLCLGGRYNLCRSMVFAATPPYDGTLATYYQVHASFAHKVPDHMTLEEASLMEPLSVAVHAAVARGRPGRRRRDPQLRRPDGGGDGEDADPGHSDPLPGQPHPCGQHPGHLDPHPAQQAERIRR